MFRVDENRQFVPDLIFTTIDTLFVLASVIISIFLRFHDRAHIYYFFSNEYAVPAIIFTVLLIQFNYYFFDLHDSRYYGDRNKMFILFLKSFMLSYVFILAISYLAPSLNIGWRLIVIKFSLIFAFCFSWRLLYSRLFKTNRSTERILIIGTGALARKISEEITNNGDHGFEIVGFIDENIGKIKERI